jgi:hypothetical protein
MLTWIGSRMFFVIFQVVFQLYPLTLSYLGIQLHDIFFFLLVSVLLLQVIVITFSFKIQYIYHCCFFFYHIIKLSNLIGLDPTVGFITWVTRFFYALKKANNTWTLFFKVKKKIDLARDESQITYLVKRVFGSEFELVFH